MVLLFLALVPLASFLSLSASEIQRTKHFSNVSTNYADALRLRDILADERYAQLLKDLRSPAGHRVNRKKRAVRNPFGDGNGEVEMTTVYATPRKNTKRTKTEKKTTKHASLQTSTPQFGPSKSSTKSKPVISPTKYHYYPHNQHMYYLPECAIQQVCNAVYVRLNYTQPLCACPPRYRDPCSASLNEDDNHTLKLIGNEQKKAITLAKTCEATSELRDCRPPRDWAVLALQNGRTGKSHYLVICKCPPSFRLEGPLAHDQPTYAGLPGINVYGMLCVPPQQSATQSFVSMWKENQRFPVSQYRSKNSTITAAETEEVTEEDNSIESETKLYETTVTEGYLLDEQQTDDATNSVTDEAFTEQPGYTTDTTKEMME